MDGQTTTYTLENFATIEDHRDLADALTQKISDYRRWYSSKGYVSLQIKKLVNYYGNSWGGNSSQQVNAGGSEGELSLMKINDIRTLGQEQLVTITSQRPAGIARAINEDVDSLKSAKIGTALAEYYMTEKGIEQLAVNCCEIGLVCDEGFADLFWDKNLGNPVAPDPETGKFFMSGDLSIRIHCPWNVARDFGLNPDQQNWVIISRRTNKWDLAARYPKFRDQIITSRDTNLPEIPMNKIPEGSDACYEHIFIHDKTPGVQRGRYSIMVGDTIVLDLKELPYKDYPVERVTPSDVIDGPTGYCAMNDCMGLEQMTDGLHSIIASNAITFGGNNILLPTGIGWNVSDIAKGVRALEADPALLQHVRIMETCRTSPEIFNYIGLLGQKKERALGSVGSVLSAQAQQGASGSAMALIQSQAIAYNSGAQRSYFKFLSNLMSKAIGIFQVYVDSEQIIKVVGKTKGPGLKAFRYTGKDLEGVSSIVYEIVNPTLQTYGGKMQLADKLLEAGQIKSPKEYINLVTTGQLEVLTWDSEADGMLIIEENEAFTDGEQVPDPVFTENHEDHIKSHNSLITLEAKRNNAQMVQSILDHVDAHYKIWEQLSVQYPGKLMAIGLQPMPVNMPPQGGPGTPPPPGAPGPVGPLGAGTDSPAQQEAEGVRAAQMPKIAGSNERAVVPGAEP